MEPSCWHHLRTVSGEIASPAKELAVFYILNDTIDLRFHRGHGISKVLHLSTPKDAVVHGLRTCPKIPCLPTSASLGLNWAFGFDHGGAEVGRHGIFGQPLSEFCHFGVHLQRGCCRQDTEKPNDFLSICYG